MPGAGKQSTAVQAQIKELLEAGFDPTTIHRHLKVGRSSIYRMKRCLEQHGTAYPPVGLHNKNGRPKALTAQQELEVRDWLANPQNRTRYLDDLVWLIHDRFDIVCSTTTMSKLRRKWLHAIECEEDGKPLDESIRAQLMETHPNLPILHQQQFRTPQAPPIAQMVDQDQSPYQNEPFGQPAMHDPRLDSHPDHIDSYPMLAGLQQLPQNGMVDPSLSPSLQQQQQEQHFNHDQEATKPENDFDLHQYQHLQQVTSRQHMSRMDDQSLHQRQQQQYDLQQMTDPQLREQQPQQPRVDERLEQRLQREIAAG